MSEGKPRSRLWRWIALIVFLIVLGVLYDPLKDLGAQLYRAAG
jgi:hypothetical protein